MHETVSWLLVEASEQCSAKNRCKHLCAGLLAVNFRCSGIRSEANKIAHTLAIGRSLQPFIKPILSLQMVVALFFYAASLHFVSFQRALHRTVNTILHNNIHKKYLNIKSVISAPENFSKKTFQKVSNFKH
jgi:hypothetical protein